MEHHHRILLLFALAAAVALALAPAAGADDPANPDHNLTDVTVWADNDELFFNVTVEGTAPASEPGKRAYRVNFTLRSAEERQAGTGPGREYFIAIDEDASSVRYILWNDVEGNGLLGTELSTQPTAENSTVTFRVDRSNARTITHDPAEAGDAVVGVDATFYTNGTPVDQAAGDDYAIPERGLDADRDLHLSATEEVAELGSRDLVPEAPGAGATPRTDPVYADEVGPVRFETEPVDDPLILEAATVNLWMSFTTTTPNLALNAPNALLYSVAPDGERTLLAQREEYRSSANPNVFTTPGQPHELTWSLEIQRDRVPAGHSLQLEVRSQGLLGEGAQGPHLLYYNSTTFDSTVHLDASVGEPPDVVESSPPLGTFLFTLQGKSQRLGPSGPGSGPAEPVPATGGPNQTLARWTSAPLDRDLPLEGARGTAWLSSVTTTPLLALNFVDFQVYQGTGRDATLVAQRETVAEGGNENIFTTPATPQKYSWPLTTYADAIPAGEPIEVRVVAESLPGLSPTSVLVHSNSTEMNSRLRVDAGTVQADVAPDPIPVDTEANFTADPPAGEAPFTVTWEFGDNSSTTVTTDGSPVNVTHAYDSTGVYEPVVQVTSAAGKADGLELEATVVDPGNVTRLTDVEANPFLPEIGTVQVTWGSDAAGNTTVRYGPAPDDLSNEVSIDENVTDHVVNLTGLPPAATFYYEVQTEDVVSDVRTFTVAPDLSGDGHVVVASIDSGINPYHEAFRRPGLTAHPATYLTGFPEDAQPLDLTFSAPTYSDAVQADRATWEGIQEQETYWVPGTNLLVRDQGDVSFATADTDDQHILDEVGHGTHVAGTVEKAHPGATILSIESTENGAVEWAANQPYVDVISLSYGGAALGPLAEVSDAIKDAQRNGKMLVVSAGNNPNPHVVTQPNGPPQAISVGGAHPSDRADAFLASKNPDVVSNFTVTDLPDKQSKQARSNATGTSFAAPNVAGTLAAAIEDLRWDLGETDEATKDGLLDVPPGPDRKGRYLADGVLTNQELRDAMNRSAEYWDARNYDPTSPLDRPISIPLPVAPGAPWLQQGWGFMGPVLHDELAATAAGDAHPTKPVAAQAYMETHQELRRRYHQPPSVGGGPDTVLDPVEVPGPRNDVRQLDQPVETPHPYPNDATLTYTIHEPGAEALSIHFEEFSVETGYDRVFVETPNGTPIGAFTLDGQSSFWTPYFPGDTIQLRLVSDAFVQRHGFVVNEVDVAT